jgi:hypothetical protein
LSLESALVEKQIAPMTTLPLGKKDAYNPSLVWLKENSMYIKTYHRMRTSKPRPQLPRGQEILILSPRTITSRILPTHP